MRADAREKRAALITAAWDLFAVNGPEVPLRTVAAEAVSVSARSTAISLPGMTL